jgi:hypothetical protein
LTQLLLGHATDFTAYPIDALNSTPFIVDDLSSAFGHVLSPAPPLPRTDSPESLHRAPAHFSISHTGSISA